MSSTDVILSSVIQVVNLERKKTMLKVRRWNNSAKIGIMDSENGHRKIE